MHLVLIRHGEPDYSEVNERHYPGFGKDLAKLTPQGLEQAEAVSHNARLQGAQLIVSSPYTRALQTAAIISRNTGLPIQVETDLHEWMPDLTFQYDSWDYVMRAVEECTKYRGRRDDSCLYQWEDLAHVAERAYRCLANYAHYEKLVIVAHGMLMRQFKFVPEIPYCGILELEWTPEMPWPGFIERQD